MIYTIIGAFREDLLSGLSLYFGESLKKEVILMHERRKHIEKDHGGEMTEVEMEEMLGALQTVISDPDHVFEDERNKGSILLIRRIKGTLNLNVVVRLALARDGTGRENSVITCFLLRDSNLVKLDPPATWPLTIVTTARSNGANNTKESIVPTWFWPISTTYPKKQVLT